MKTEKSIFACRRLNLDGMIRSTEFNLFREQILGNDLFIDDPERAARIYDAAEFGCDGSFHAEIIQDWRDFLNTLTLPESVREDIEIEIYNCELWHENNGSLYTQCS